MTVEYARDHPETTSKVVTTKLANLLYAHGSDIKPSTDSRLASQPAYDYWKDRLPRSIAQVLSMPQDHPDMAGFLAAMTAEITSIRDMGTYDPADVLDEDQIKTSKVGMSKCVFTKKYHPDGTFNK